MLTGNSLACLLCREQKCASLGTHLPISSAKNKNAQRPTFAWSHFAPYPRHGGRRPRRLRRDREPAARAGISLIQRDRIVAAL
jgi:hypothetical protein